MAGFDIWQRNEFLFSVENLFKANGQVTEPVSPSDVHIAHSVSNDETASPPPLQEMPQSATLPTDDTRLIQLDTPLSQPPSPFAIEIVDGNFCASDSEQILFDVNVKIPAGDHLHYFLFFHFLFFHFSPFIFFLFLFFHFSPFLFFFFFFFLFFLSLFGKLL